MEDAEFDGGVLELVVALLHEEPGQTVDELADEVNRDGTRISPGALRMAMNERVDLFQIGRGGVWHIRSEPLPQGKPDDSPPANPAPLPSLGSPPPPKGPPAPPPTRPSPPPPPPRRRRDGIPTPYADAVERELRGRLRGCRIVAEIGLDASLLEDVERALTEALAADPEPWRTSERYPALLAVYLIGHGVYHYQNAFWNTLTIPEIDQQWGKPFEAALRRLGLETFEDMVYGDNALRYVSPILAHGGIPSYCLDDYFRLLNRGLRRAEDATDILTTWRSRRTAFDGIDRPVRRFMLYGGDLAVDFIDRSIDLFKEFGRSGKVPRPSEVGLPSYVVVAFRRFTETDRPTRLREGAGPRVARPSIHLDPWGPSGVTMLVPPMPQSSDNWEWRLQAGSSISRFGSSRFVERELPLAPARGWTVSLFDGGTTLADLSFEGLDEVPALFFHPSSGELIRTASGLRVEAAWVLHPPENEFSGVAEDGSDVAVTVAEELPDPTGEWTGFRLTCLRLNGLRALSVRASAGKPWRRLAVRPLAERPSLSSEPIARASTGTGLLVHNETPSVDLPAGEWTLRCLIDGTVADTRTVTIAEPTRLPLPIPGGCHEVELTVRGVLGADLRTTFVVCPGLVVKRPQELLFPDDRTAAVRLHGPGLSVDGAAPGSPSEVAIASNADEAWCSVADDDGNTFDIGVRVSKVLWAVVDPGVVVDRPFGNEPGVLTASELAGRPAPSLLIRTGAHEYPLQLSLSQAGAVVQQSDVVHTAGGEGRWLFDLGRFADAVSRSDAPLLEFVLWVGKRPVTVAHVRQELRVSNLRAVSRLTDDFGAIDLTFDEERVLDNRVARLWSLSRPWEPAVTAPIPPGQSGHMTISGYGLLHAGDHLAEIGVDDGWTTSSRPRVGDPGTGFVTIGSSADVQARLDRAIEGDAFAVLEAALVTGWAARALSPEEHDEICEAAVVSACAMADGALGRLDATSPGFTALRWLLTDAGGGLADGVVRYAERLGRDSHPLMALSIEYAGALPGRLADHELRSSTARALWSVAPVMASAIDLARPFDADCVARVTEFTGWDPHDDAPPPPGEPITQLFIGMGADQLRSLAFDLDLVPGQLLNLDGLVLAHFEWLRADKERPGLAEHWWHTHQLLGRRADECFPEAADHLASRVPPTGTTDWAALPKVSLAAALEVVTHGERAGLATRALMELVAFAPRLVTRDLLLAQVLTIRKHLEPNPDRTE